MTVLCHRVFFVTPTRKGLQPVVCIIFDIFVYVVHIYSFIIIYIKLIPEKITDEQKQRNLIRYNLLALLFFTGAVLDQIDLMN